MERINIIGQHPQRGEDPAPRDPDGGGRPLHEPEARPRAKQRLTNLNYFDKVEATTAPGSTKDKIVVNIDVTEKPTGLFSIGGGYSSPGRRPRHPRPLAAQLPRQGLGGVPPPARRRESPAGHHRLHRALALRPAAGRRLRHLQHPAHPARLHGQLAGRRRPARPSPRGVLALERDVPGQPGRISDVNALRQPGAPLGRRAPTSRPWSG